MLYDKYSYIFPPRPEHPIHPKYIGKYDDGTFIAEPKLNGDCAMIFTNGKDIVIRDRNNAKFKKPIPELDAVSQHVHRGEDGKWMVVVGEAMQKSKKDMQGIPLKGYVLFDIIVYNGVHLSNYTFEERHAMLVELFKANVEYDPYILKTTISGLYVVKAFTDHFEKIFDEVKEIDMYEGLVIKKRNAKLELGITSKNNLRTQFKFRKPAKNYHY